MSLHEVLCTLAKWHKGEHSDVGIRGRKSCGFIMGHVEIDDDPAGSPEEHRRREEDEIQEGTERDRPACLVLGGPPSYQAPAEEAVSAVEPVALVPVYPLIDSAVRDLVRGSLMGLSLHGIAAQIPGSDLFAIAGVLTRAIDDGAVSFYESDDDPPVRVYVGAPTTREPVASAVAGEPEPPTVAALVASYCSEYSNHLDAINTVADARDALGTAESIADGVALAVARAADRLARRIGDKQVQIGEDRFCAVRPRKPRGKPVDPAALWSLERVEVAK